MSEMQKPPATTDGSCGDLGDLEPSLDTSDHDECQEAIGLDEGLLFVRYANSYTRMPTAIGLFWRMKYADWLKVLGDAWDGCDNISAHLSWLRIMLPRRGPVRQMMTPAEQAAYDALPDRLTIYRGARRHPLGASWSLDRSVAERFPHLMRYNFGGNPVLISAEVRKRDVLAIKLDRGESEVIVLRGRHILSREPIEARAAS